MLLQNFYSRGFSPNARRKGEVYYAEGRVEIVEQEEGRLLAEVRGTEVYEVELQIDDDTLNAGCNCKAFDANGFCKHVWATFLAADTAGLLQTAVVGKLPYIPMGVVSEVDDFWDEPAADEFRYDTFKPTPPRRADWKSILEGIAPAAPTEMLKPRQHLIYVVDVAASPSDQRLVLQVLLREHKMNGEFSKPRKSYIPSSVISQLPDPIDIQYLSILLGSREQRGSAYYDYNNSDHSMLSTYTLTPILAGTILPQLAATGRLFVARDQRCHEVAPLSCDRGARFVCRLRVHRKEEAGEAYAIRAIISRDSEEYDLQDVDLVCEGIFIRNDVLAFFDWPHDFHFLLNLKAAKSVSVPNRHVYKFIKGIAESGNPAVLELDPKLAIEIVKAAPRPQFVFKNAGNAGLDAKLSFVYGDEAVLFKEQDPKGSLLDVKTRRLVERDLKEEARWKGRFEEIGMKRQSQLYTEPEWRVSRARFPETARRLLSEGCIVFAEGRHFRRGGDISVSVSSGIDWFELHGAAEFEGQAVKFPELLAALGRGEQIVQLTDGTFGLIPEDWLKKYGAIAGLGEIHEDHLRYRMNQTSLLDALLAAQPDAAVDATFQQARERLRLFDGVGALDPPEGFVGRLREYQMEALGWMKFLRDFGFGGCLADDMGLGKTVMVLALIQSRRVSGEQNPSLIVVPRSLVFNWIQEASRFVPSLRILDHTGTSRKKSRELFEAYDIVLTTYGTLRGDAAWLKDHSFDYIILDEAQMVKNASTASAKAVRLLQGKHRLALSGTPVQNHLGDLWSLFEFLNSGMLGASSVLNLAGSGAKKPDEQTVTLLARALRPFILRRTKEQVATELPAKVEQTIFCELTADERRLYNELRDHYRESLLSRVNSVGLSRSKIQVLEALLRLRQAACHPGLIDHQRTSEMSTKLETLIPQLVDVIEEGHKALVFSQFVSFLTILRRHLDADGIAYQYLDGQTTDRQSPVEAFQNDPGCKLFLISLKAGGLGLNLTAADYVFLLDPWWNPVIEAQAIDRSHRIGQLRQVFAYRIIARDTVEEKVLQLQETKRNLADAIITGDNSLLRSIQREDLELLLS